MTCEEIKLTKHAYADCELDLAHSLEIEKHLGGCPACKQAIENIRALKTVIKTSDIYFTASPDLKRRISAAIGGNSKKPEPRAVGYSWNWLKFGLSFATVCLVALLVVPSLLSPSGNDQIAQEVMSSHVRSLMASHLTDVLSTDQHTVKPWFDGKLDFAPPVVNPTEQGFPLVGGRLDYLQGRPVAALVYQRQKHFINVFVWPANGKLDAERKAEARQGYNLIHWNAGGMTFWAVSDLNQSELREFTELIK